MRKLRFDGQERPQWALEEFLHALASNPPATAWRDRVFATYERLRTTPAPQSPLDWARLAADLLHSAGWPGAAATTGSSAAYQARQRWNQVLEECGALGFDGSRTHWAEFVTSLSSAAANAIFATESSAPTASGFSALTKNTGPAAASRILCCPSACSATAVCRMPLRKPIGRSPTRPPHAC
jgi:hypothetical protein